jgi:H+-transporting ATPase
MSVSETSPGMETVTKAEEEELSAEELEKRLNASRDGLTGAEVSSRLKQYGYNEITEKEINPIIKFLTYFWGPIPWMIMLAAILSGILQHWDDLGVILALLVMNAVVGFREEYQAGNVIEELKRQLAVQARVKRDGTWTMVPRRELVPGDIIRVRLGDIVPADAKVVSDEPVEVDQSALTGESLPVERGKDQVLYSGSILRLGEAEALVYGTGTHTYYGKTAELVEEAETPSHLQQAVIKIADYLIFVALGLAVVIVVVSFLRGDPFFQVLQFGLVLTVAAVPVAMPAVLSVTMALGAGVLAKKKAIVTKLTSVEELAGIDILCSDKTGTLTQNKLTLGKYFTREGEDPDEVLLCAALASQEEDQDTIDMAILRGLSETLQEKLRSLQVTHFTPFDPVHKRTEATVTAPEGVTFKATKGAPQVILGLDPDADNLKMVVDTVVDEFAQKGYRSLGVACTRNGDNWRLLGILPLFDPLREDSKETVKTAEDMGIQVKMVTGDQIAIAREIGKQLGLSSNIVNADIFSKTQYHEAGSVDDAIEKADGFAQVFPEHKFHIVDVLQRRGHIVGMTGDGVNDAPALKKADAGIAVSGSTDAARAAADIVLLKPGLSVIIDAIKEARKIFQRMLNYTIYRIAETFALLIFITLVILLFNFYPVTAIMIVLLAILNDGAILSIAYDNVRYSNKPEAWDMKFVLALASAIGLFAVLRSFGIFYIADSFLGADPGIVQTMVYLNLSVGGHLTVFVARTRGPFWSIPPAHILLYAVIGTQIAATFIAVYGILMAPIGWEFAGIVWVYTLILFLVQDQVKRFAYRIFSPEPSGLLVKERRRRQGRKSMAD